MFDQLVRAINDIETMLDEARMTEHENLIHRCWLVHSLVFAFLHAESRHCNTFLEALVLDKNLSAIALACPHLLRYVGACLILSFPDSPHSSCGGYWQRLLWRTSSFWKNRSYSDPITKFMLAICAESGADEARLQLSECEQSCHGDPLLHTHRGEFERRITRLLENVGGVLEQARCIICGCGAEQDVWGERICWCDSCQSTGCKYGETSASSSSEVGRAGHDE